MSAQLKRREFIKLLGGAAAAWPIAARAQQALPGSRVHTLRNARWHGALGGVAAPSLLWSLAARAQQRDNQKL